MGEKRSLVSVQLDKHLVAHYTDSRRFTIYQTGTFIVTFVTYMVYHVNRKVLSVVKQEWNENCTIEHPEHNDTDPYWCDWEPFNKINADTLLGYLDASYLLVYAVALYLSGYLADRSNLRIYLCLGMLLSGFFNLMMGAAYSFDIHSFAYFLIINMLAGMFQATGWPSVVSLMGSWFGHKNRGFITGIWNIHTSLGNMLGSLIAGYYVSSAWGLSFAVPAVMMMVWALVVFVFIIPHPSDAHLPDPNKLVRDSRRSSDITSSEECTSLLEDEQASATGSGGVSHRRSVSKDEDGGMSTTSSTASLAHADNDKAISIMTAILIPGVITYSLALFFIKFVNYVFMYWLPFYIHFSTTYTAKMSATMSIFFDAGGMFGGMMAGALSDKFKKPANISLWMIVGSIPTMYVYNLFGSLDAALGAFLLTLTGFFCNGPYALITTAVATELGMHESLQGNAKALATVAAVIDGTGSLGAAAGPFLTGIVADNMGWDKVFYMLMIASAISILCLGKLVLQELRRSCSCFGGRPSDLET
uniref:Sugar phosphate exchanger 3 n=1 Tax=Hirondellea gigas TaxID=1518452 RepID=A0A6A7GAA0_9CRUS